MQNKANNESERDQAKAPHRIGEQRRGKPEQQDVQERLKDPVRADSTIFTGSKSIASPVGNTPSHGEAREESLSLDENTFSCVQGITSGPSETIATGGTPDTTGSQNDYTSEGGQAGKRRSNDKGKQEQQNQ